MPYCQVSQATRWPIATLLAWAGLVALALLVAGSHHARAVGEQVEPAVDHVLEGDAFSFNVSMPSVSEPQGQRIQVGCQGCGAGWTTPPLTGWREVRPGTWNRSLSFPGTLFPASAHLEPKFARNYTVSLVNAASPLAQANVTVHAVDDWTQPNSTYSSGGAVRIQLSGFTAGEKVHVNLSKWAKSGAINRVASLVLTAGFDGVASTVWTMPRELATDFDCPHLEGQCKVFTLDVQSRSKVENVQFRGDRAVLRSTIHYLAIDPADSLPVEAPLPPAPGSYNRTENVTILVELRYANNALMQGPDRTLANDPNLNGTLKLAVEQVVAPGLANGSAPNAPLAYLFAKPTNRGWRASWQVPMNLTATVSNTDQPQYRVRVLGQVDRYGSLIAETNASGFRVTPLLLHPQLIKAPPSVLERTDNATAVWYVRYADGTPWDNKTGQNPMTASLVASTGDVVRTLPTEYRGNGTWATWYVPPVGFKELGFYKLRLDKNNDKWDNAIVAESTAPISIVPASPRVDLRTTAGDSERNETQGFARGESVHADAHITYPDGTPFNVSSLPRGKSNVTVTIERIDASGGSHGKFQLYLDPIDGEAGLWSGDFDLDALDGEHPVGPWRWSVDFTDKLEVKPNGNATSWIRWVHGSFLDVAVVGQPTPLVRAGDKATVRFTAHYANETILDEALASGGIVVYVSPWVNGHAGAPVATLYPVYNATRQDWAATWTTNATTYVGDYVLSIEGLDVFGNLLRPTTTRPIGVFVDKLVRQTLVEPPETAHRGEEVLVIFDGADGDIAPQDEASPRIELQKWNPLRGAWEVDKRNVRVSDPNSTDHLGRVLTGTRTNLGQYRFVLFARDVQHATIHAISRSFKVLPVELERNWTGPFAAANVSLTKGQPLELQLERQQGDRVESVRILKDGQRVANATAIGRTGRFDIAWNTQYAVPAGAYTVVVHGRDLNNNTFASPAKGFVLAGVDLQARQPQPPEGALPRASRVDLKVVVQFPDQQTVKAGNFSARFVLGNETVHTVVLEHNRSAWLGNWTIPASAALGAYRVLVDGDDGFGDRARGEEVFSFQLGSGVLERGFTAQKLIANRTETVVWLLPAQQTDASMRFTLRDDAGARRELNSTLTRTGDYVVQWKTARDEKLGRYQLEAQGMDTAGNAVHGAPRPLLLRPAQIGAKFLDPPKELKPNEEGRWVIQLQYADGTLGIADPENRPNIAMLFGDKVFDKPAPKLTIEEGQWVATWTPPSGAAGIFKLAIGGKDALGNEIQLRTGPNFRINEGFAKEILGVPGFEVFLLPLALGAAAFVVRRRA